VHQLAFSLERARQPLIFIIVCTVQAASAALRSPEENGPRPYHNALDDWLAGYTSPVNCGAACIYGTNDLSVLLAFKLRFFQTVQIQVFVDER